MNFESLSSNIKIVLKFFSEYGVGYGPIRSGIIFYKGRIIFFIVIGIIHLRESFLCLHILPM